MAEAALTRMDAADDFTLLRQDAAAADAMATLTFRLPDKSAITFIMAIGNNSQIINPIAIDAETRDIGRGDVKVWNRAGVVHGGGEGRDTDISAGKGLIATIIGCSQGGTAVGIGSVNQ